MRSDHGPRELNWAGHSLETIAAMYESDAAAKELGRGELSWGYLEAAFSVECASAQADAASPDLIKSSQHN
jgi:hypothetical protein